MTPIHFKPILSWTIIFSRYFKFNNLEAINLSYDLYNINIQHVRKNHFLNNLQ